MIRMRTISRLSNRTLVFLLITTLLICLVWLVGPRVYVTGRSMLPASWIRKPAVAQSTMQKKVATLKAKISKLQNENRQLRAGEADLPASISTTTLPAEYQTAQILARPPQSPYDVLLINKGNKQGVAVGAPVWWPPGIFLGEVVEVRSDNSLVRLVSSQGTRHVGRFDSRIVTETEGRGGGAMRATVPAGAEVATGTLAVSDRWGVPYARIVKTEPAAALAKQRLFLQPLISASVIEGVYVGR